jgi:hypothetical protein
MNTLITRLLLVIALTTGVAAAHLSLQQKPPDDPAIVSNAEASPQEATIVNKDHEDQKNYGTILPHKPEVERTKKVMYEPGLLILLGVSLISAASYLRRVSHQEKLRSRNE